MKLRRNSSHWSTALVVVGVASLVFLGCAQNSGGDGSVSSAASLATNGTGFTGVGGANPLDSQPGSTVDIILNGSTYQQKLQTLTNYVETHALNAPVDFQLNVQLGNNGQGMYQGQILMAYYDYTNYPSTGQWFVSNLGTGTGSDGNTSFPNAYGKPDAYYNQWFLYGGRPAFHAFFQDQIGAVILVVDNAVTLGDGGNGTGTVSGEIYFKNFAVTQSQDQPDDQCWFFPSGPFSCATFFQGNQPVTTSALYPSSNDGYQLLGTFSGLNQQQAFGQ